MTVSGFGYHPTEAAFASSFHAGKGWDEGTWIDPEEKLAIPLQASVLSYALSVFEGIKAHSTVGGRILLFRARDHALRFQRSAEIVGLPPFPVDDFIRVARETALRNVSHLPPTGEGSLYLRPVLFADAPRLGLGIPDSARFVLYASPVREYFETSTRGLRLLLLDRARVPAGGIGHAKCSANYAGTLLVRQQAQSEGFDDVLFRDARDPAAVSELTGANIFALLDDSLVVTPSLSDQILAGITRASVLFLLRKMDFRVEQRALSVQELLSAREVVCTGTAWGVVGVRQLKPGSSSPVDYSSTRLADGLAGKLKAIHSGKEPDQFGSELI